MDSDDEFLYGPSKSDPEPPASTSQSPPLSVPKPIPASQIRADSNGIVAQLEDEIFGDLDDPLQPETNENAIADAEDGGQVEDGDEEEESEDDVEIIMEPTSRSLDLRQGRPSTNRSTSITYTQPKPGQSLQAPSLTTEYTPRERGGSTKPQPPQPQAQQQPPPPPPPPQQQQHLQTSTLGDDTASQNPLLELEGRLQIDEGPDPNSLAPALAPPSHPHIDPTVVGMLDGRSILEVDLNAMTEKPWRRPGSDISDWFNYGFDEVSWEAYCYRRKEVGDVANLLKANVVNYAGMPEEQITALPPEIRSMVMAGATTFMSAGGTNAGIMPTNVGMPMMGDMAMNMPQMGMMNGMNGDMSGMQMGVPMQDNGSVGTGIPVQIQQDPGVGDGFGGPSAAMMSMMGGDYGMQDPNMMQQQMYPVMEGGNTPVQTQAVRPGPPAPFRGRGQGLGMRGRGAGFQGRGGRPQAIPVRPASPLPPNVPTGPRNQNKYKDRDGNAAGVDGLDYGGGRDVNSGTPPEERARKRRGSPVIDDARSKRR